MAIAIVAIVVVVVVVASAYLARRVQHPERTASHDDDRITTTSEQLEETADRPAGPDAEDPIGPTRLDEGDVPPGSGRA